MIQTLNLQVTPEQAATASILEKVVREQAQGEVAEYRVIRRSIDARQRNIKINLTVAYTDKFGEIQQQKKNAEIQIPRLPQDAPPAIVVGFGPAGIFAAVRLIQLGIKPIVVERGKDVDARRTDLAALSRTGEINPNSNYCFGEGGAGAFSDGKLYTRSKKRGDVDSILQLLYQHGASEDILIDAHPHIGTDRLPQVIKSLRMAIINAGGIVMFNKHVDSLIIKKDKCCGVQCSDGSAFMGPVILATGHSARDIYMGLHRQGVELQPKGIAVGVRVEHPQQLIDQLMYHSPQGRGKFLPPAEYSMLTRVDGRAVYSFCMCPGGYIIPAANEDGIIVVNGMSPSNRGTKWANSGMVVEVLPEDIDGDYPLKMMAYQQDIEATFSDDTIREKIKDTEMNPQNAPAQRLTDFVKGKASESTEPSSYTAGIHCARVDQLLPKPVARRLQKGFEDFDKKYRGFVTPKATIIGPETRTSSPVRIPRDPQTMQHVGISGLFPCGEGAGYAGGIVSAALDGVRSADALAQMLKDQDQTPAEANQPKKDTPKEETNVKSASAHKKEIDKSKTNSTNEKPRRNPNPRK